MKKDDNVIELLKDLSVNLKKEINGKSQLYDFLTLKDNFSTPNFTTVSTTCGVLDNKVDYKEFQVTDSVFISYPVVSVYNPVLMVHTYTYKGLGFYFCCTYNEPYFHKEKSKLFLDNIIKIIKTICNEDNKDMKIDDLIKIMD